MGASVSGTANMATAGTANAVAPILLRHFGQGKDDLGQRPLYKGMHLSIQMNEDDKRVDFEHHHCWLAGPADEILSEIQGWSDAEETLQKKLEPAHIGDSIRTSPITLRKYLRIHGHDQIIFEQTPPNIKISTYAQFVISHRPHEPSFHTHAGSEGEIYCLSAEKFAQALRLAIDSLGTPYDLQEYNCQHFASYIMTGKKVSPLLDIPAVQTLVSLLRE